VSLQKFMLHREILAAYREGYTKHINTLCVKTAEFLDVKADRTYDNHWALMS
jgi:hypothetical protein